MKPQNKKDILITIQLILFTARYCYAATNNSNDESELIDLIDNLFIITLAKDPNKLSSSLIPAIISCCHTFTSGKLLLTFYCNQLLQLTKPCDVESIAKLLPEKPQNTKEIYNYSKALLDSGQTEKLQDENNSDDIFTLIVAAKMNAIEGKFTPAIEQIEKATNQLKNLTKYERIRHLSIFSKPLRSFLCNTTTKLLTDVNDITINLLSAIVKFLQISGFLEPKTIINFLSLAEEFEKIISEIIAKEKHDVSTYWLEQKKELSSSCFFRNPEIETLYGPRKTRSITKRHQSVDGKPTPTSDKVLKKLALIAEAEPTEPAPHPHL